MSRPPSPPKSTARTAGKPAREPAGKRGKPHTGARKAKVAKSTKRASDETARESPSTGRKPPPKRQREPARPVAAPRPWLDRLAGLRRIPAFVYFFASVVLLAVLVPAVNWIYQVVRKPSELLFPVSDEWYKTPGETWRTYGPLFVANSTAIMSAELLAALAQQEASGNPVARTYWRWSATSRPFEIYRPASSAVGMFQLTDSTFDEARHYCIRDHRVAADGPWYDWGSCWFNSLYSRVLPSHAVELAASNLDRRVRETLARNGIRHATLRQQQELAIITHLCGAGAAAAYAARGLQLVPGQHCGDHDTLHYVQRVMALAQVFAALRK